MIKIINENNDNKIIKTSESLNDKNKSDNKKQKSFENYRTSFWISVCFLILESVSPSIIVWLITNPNFITKIFKVEVGVAIGLIFIVYGFIIIITFIIYMLGWHNCDQFTYNLGFAGLIMGFYLGQFWWNLDHIIYNVLIGVSFLIFSLLIGTLFSVYARKIKIMNDS